MNGPDDGKETALFDPEWMRKAGMTVRRRKTTVDRLGTLIALVVVAALVYAIVLGCVELFKVVLG